MTHDNLLLDRIAAWGASYLIVTWQPLIWEDFRSLCHKLLMSHVVLWVERIL